MAAKREQEEEEEEDEDEGRERERKRIFDFIDSFRYTGSGVSRRGSHHGDGGSKTFFLISKRDTHTHADTGPQTIPTPSPPVIVNTNRTRKRRPKDEPIKQVIGPDTPIAVAPIATLALEGRRKTEPKCRRRSSLTATEKVMEAYQRVPPGFDFTPPRSSHRLLQEDHAFDPWRVLIICMLLNNTTGAQVKKVLEDLFALCPDAHTTLQVDVELIGHVIRSLGLQNKRARMIKILSQEYLHPDWTHVTSLHGVGKYAADAYAIFCTGKGADVRPDDHKLVDYWNSIYGNGSGSDVMPQFSSWAGQPKKQGSSSLLLYKLEARQREVEDDGEPSRKGAAPNAGNESHNKRKKGVSRSGSENETAGTTDNSDMPNNGVTNGGDGTVSHFYLDGVLRDMIHTHQCPVRLSTADNVIACIGASKANDLEAEINMLRIDAIKLCVRKADLISELCSIVANEMAKD